MFTSIISEDPQEAALFQLDGSADVQATACAILADELRGEAQQAKASASGDPEDDTIQFSLTDAKRVFGFKSTKELTCFLDRHPEVKQDRPLTKTGKKHSRRRNVSLLDLARAISRDDKIISDPARRARMEARLKKAQLGKELEDQALAYITGETK